jgi:hypothetical protein
VTERLEEANEQKEIFKVSLTLSRSRFVGVLWLLALLRNTRFHFRGLQDGRTWREGVLSLEHRRRNETKKYHPAQQSPHENRWLPGNENPHSRTSWDEEPRTIAVIILRKNQTFHEHLASVFSLRSCERAKNGNAMKDVLPRL